eukprot:SAG11_NODE_106_length_16423_cov_51.220840_22_plen_208_part_00
MRLSLLSSQAEHAQSVQDAVAAAAAAAAADVDSPPSADAGVEPWFGLPFARSALDATLVAEWAQGKARSEDVSALHMALPPPNHYIPTNFQLLPLPLVMPDGTDTSVLPEDDTGGAREGDRPMKLSLIEGDASGRGKWCTLHWKPDRVFRTPRGAVFLELRCASQPHHHQQQALRHPPALRPSLARPFLAVDLVCCAAPLHLARVVP